MTTWHDRVVRRIEVLDAQERDDTARFEWLLRELNDQRSRRDGERVVPQRDLGEATVHYKDYAVFTFGVREGEITIRDATGETSSFTEPESALNKMSDLMARAVRRAHADADDDDRPERVLSVASRYLG